jgi:hypothetical protein
MMTLAFQKFAPTISPCKIVSIRKDFELNDEAERSEELKEKGWLSTTSDTVKRIT